MFDVVLSVIAVIAGAVALELFTAKAPLGYEDERGFHFGPEPRNPGKPSQPEKSELLSLLTKEEKHFAWPDAKPGQLIAADPAHPTSLPKGITPAQLAAWTVVSRVLLNLDETITKE